MSQEDPIDGENPRDVHAGCFHEHEKNFCTKILTANELREIRESKVAALGSGADTTVYKVKYGDKDAALKEASFIPNEFVRHNIKKEFEILNILHGADKAPCAYAMSWHPPVLVMELCTGQSFYELIWERKTSGLNIIRMINGISRNLHEVHQKGIVHFDLKTDNVMIEMPSMGDDPDAMSKVWLIDFGLSGFIGDYIYVNCHPNSHYAPEYDKGGSPLSAAGDVYSLGILMKDSLYPMPENSYSDTLAKEGLRQIAEMAVDPRPWARPSLREIVAMLDELERQIKAHELSVFWNLEGDLCI